ncbi:hypothetical protein Rs2_16484 [Raphanus sativus]|nr:hypothetical protein Rs2_16484 [Raphanus sativus]
MSDHKGKGKAKAGSKKQNPPVLPPRRDRVSGETKTSVLTLIDAAKTTPRVGGVRMSQNLYDAYLEALENFLTTHETVAFMKQRVPEVYLPDEIIMDGFKMFLKLLEGENAGVTYENEVRNAMMEETGATSTSGCSGEEEDANYRHKNEAASTAGHNSSSGEE